MILAQNLLLLLKNVEKTCTFTQKWLDLLLLMTSSLVTIETEHHWTWLKMRGMNEHLLKTLGADVLSCRRKLRKTLGRGVASTPFVRPRVKIQNTHKWMYLCLSICTNGWTYAFYYSNGSLKADVGVLATINVNTTSKSEAINYLINGIDVALGKHIKGFILLGKQIIRLNRMFTF